MSREETLIHTESVRVRVMPLAPGGATPWHFHREVTDHIVALSGLIRVRFQQPAEEIDLQPGGRCAVAVGRVHQVANGDPSGPSSYLLIQGVGHYDFNEI